MAQLFGKNYTEAGSSSSPLLLRSNGEIKVQWGNKYIDLVKNGKINSSASSEIIKQVSSTDAMISTGIYYNTSDETIYISVNGTTQKISSSDSSYISFLEAQELTNEQKSQALVNIGFEYESLESLNQAAIDTGLVYVKESNKLYVVTNGVASEYQVATSNTFDSLTIGDITITKNSISTNSLSIDIGGETYVQLDGGNILFNRTLIADILQSNGYVSNTKGFAIKQISGKYTLDIDSINWRNIDSELSRTYKDYTNYTLIGDYNVVTSVESLNYIEKTENSTVPADRLLLKYSNIESQDSGIITYKINTGDYILLELNTADYTEPIEFEVLEVSSSYIIIKKSEDSTLYQAIEAASQFKIYKNRVSQFIQGNGYLALRRWDSDTETYKYHTIMGSYSEEQFGISEDTTTKFGFYSDDVKVAGISLSGAQFSGSLPSYIEETPETVKGDQFPTMGVVDAAIKKATDDSTASLTSKLALPIGSIIMFNSTSNIPDGWHICDGTEGTPNLIDKFIKAGNTLEDSTITSYSKAVIADSTDETNTGKQDLQVYSLIFIMKYKD